MPRPLRITQPLRLLLDALYAEAQRWRYGYDLSRETELKSGTLYPLLIRLEELKLLETKWGEAQANGRPPRHLYRLTADGRAFARELAAEGDWASAT